MIRLILVDKLDIDLDPLISFYFVGHLNDNHNFLILVIIFRFLPGGLILF